MHFVIFLVSDVFLFTIIFLLCQLKSLEDGNWKRKYWWERPTKDLTSRMQ